MLVELRHALRSLARTPGFTFIALFTLALGLGATTVTFSLVDAVVLRPLPVAAPDRLVALSEFNTGQTSSTDDVIAYANFVDWRRDNRTLAGLALHAPLGFTVEGRDRAGHVEGAEVTAGFFELFGIAPEAGRTILAREESPGSAPVAVLSHAFWTRHFGAASDVVGRTIRLDGRPHTVVGIMPAGFRFPDNAELWTAVRAGTADAERGVRSYHGTARLRPEVSLEQAAADLNVIARRLAADHPATNANYGVRVEPFTRQVVGNFRRIALTLFGAVGCLLLITCVNLSSLQLARGAARQRDVVIRAALGASRLRLFRQVTLENLVLGLAGGAAGVLLAWWALALAPQLWPSALPYWLHLSIDPVVLLAAFSLAVLVPLIVGLAPAWQVARIDLQEVLRQGGRGGTPAATKLMRVLVGAELALAFVLLAATGLLLKSFQRLQAVPPGFNADHVLTFRLTLPGAGYPDAPRQIAAGGRLVDRLSTVPGVEAAALVSDLPLSGQKWGRFFTLAGRPLPPPGETPVALNRVVSAGYFRTMGIPLRRGREFTASDDSRSVPVAIVDEAFVRAHFPHQDPIGQRVRYSRTERYPWMEIVGVVGDVRHDDLQSDRLEPGLYVPSTQWPAEFGAYYVMRTAGDPAALRASVEAAVAEVDRGLALSEIRTMGEHLAGSLWRDRLVSRIVSGFAVMAVLLSLLGVYGVTAYAMSRRTREIGVRLALGARPADVLGLVLRGGLRLALLAVIAGTILSLLVTRPLAGLLYRVEPHDPLVLGVDAILLAGVVLAAVAVPAWRASRIAPVEALRSE